MYAYLAEHWLNWPVVTIVTCVSHAIDSHKYMVPKFLFFIKVIYYISFVIQHLSDL